MQRKGWGRSELDLLQRPAEHRRAARDLASPLGLEGDDEALGELAGQRLVVEADQRAPRGVALDQPGGEDLAAADDPELVVLPRLGLEPELF